MRTENKTKMKKEIKRVTLKKTKYHSVLDKTMTTYVEYEKFHSADLFSLLRWKIVTDKIHGTWYKVHGNQKNNIVGFPVVVFKQTEIYNERKFYEMLMEVLNSETKTGELE